MFLNRLTAVLTAFIFLASPSGLALPIMPAAIPKSPKPSAIAWNDIQVPPELGTLEARIVSADNQGPGVLIIQDAHAIADAQRSISKLIEYFQTQYGIHIVGLEGASAALDPQIFRSFPDQKILKKVFASYLEAGELAGGPAAAIFGPEGGRYYGIEDWKLYEEGLRRYREAVAVEPLAFEKLKALKESLQRQKKTAYSPELLSLDLRLTEFYENHANFLETLRQLAKIIPPASESELALLLLAAGSSGGSPKDPKTEDETDLSLEVQRLAVKIRQRLEMNGSSLETRTVLKEFNQKFQDFRTSNIEPQAFALYLKNISKDHSLTVRVSKKLFRSTENQKKLENIKGTKLFEDFEQYAVLVKKSLFQTEEEESLDAVSQRLRLIESFAKLELSSEQWLEMKQLLGHDRAWHQAGADRESDAEPEEIQRILNMLEPHFNFYETANARDGAFLKNLQALMKKEKTEHLMMVTGGFHAGAMSRMLQERGISSLVIMPAIKTFPGQETYRKQMGGDVSWKDYFEVENGKVNLYRAFVRAVRDQLLQSGKKEVESETVKSNRKRETLKQWRDQIIRDLAAQGRIEQSSQYTRFMDEVIQNKSIFTWESGHEPLVDRAVEFANGLRELRAGGQLTRDNIRGLLSPSTTIPVFEVAPFQNNLSVAGDLVGEAEVAAARSEVRSEIPLAAGEEITLELGVLLTKDRTFAIKINGEAHNRQWFFEGVPDYIQYKYSSVNTQNMSNTEYTPGDKVIFKGVEFQQIGNKITIKNTRQTSLKISLSGNIGTEKEAEAKVTAESFPVLKENNVGLEIKDPFLLSVKIKGDPKKSYWLISGNETKLSVVYIEEGEEENALAWQDVPLNKPVALNGLTLWSDGKDLILSPGKSDVELEVTDSKSNPINSLSSKGKQEKLSGDGYEYEIDGPYNLSIINAGDSEGEQWEISGDSEHLKIGYTGGGMHMYLGAYYSLNKFHTVGGLIIWSDGKRLSFKPEDPAVQLDVNGAEKLIPKSGLAVLGAIKPPAPKADEPKIVKKSLFYPIAVSGVEVEIAIVGDEIWFSFKDSNGYKMVKFNLKDNLKAFDLGRHPKMDVVIDSSHVSRTHARVKVSGTTGNYTLTVQDLGSSNGTMHQGKLLTPMDWDVQVQLAYEEDVNQEAAPMKVAEKPPQAKPQAGQLPWAALKNASDNLDPHTQVHLEYFPTQRQVHAVTSTLKHTLKTLPKVDPRIPEAIDEFDHFEDINYELLNMLMKENMTLNDYNALIKKLEAMLDQYLKLYENAAATQLSKFELIVEPRAIFEALKRNLQESLEELPPGKKPMKPLDVLPTEFVTQLRNMKLTSLF